MKKLQFFLSAIMLLTVSVAEATGFERNGNKEFVKFLWIAKGSAAEVCSQLHNAYDLDYITDGRFKSMYDSAKQIGGMLFNLITVLSSEDRRTK